MGDNEEEAVSFSVRSHFWFSDLKLKSFLNKSVSSVLPFRKRYLTCSPSSQLPKKVEATAHSAGHDTWTNSKGPRVIGLAPLLTDLPPAPRRPLPKNEQHPWPLLFSIAARFCFSFSEQQKKNMTEANYNSYFSWDDSLPPNTERWRTLNKSSEHRFIRTPTPSLWKSSASSSKNYM